jgi:hypothetical protein
MKVPNLKSYTENASTNDGTVPASKGVYRGSALDKEMYGRRMGSTKVLTAGKNK